jgi:hypothetical protein
MHHTPGNRYLLARCCRLQLDPCKALALNQKGTSARYLSFKMAYSLVPASRLRCRAAQVRRLSWAAGRRLKSAVTGSHHLLFSSNLSLLPWWWHADHPSSNHLLAYLHTPLACQHPSVWKGVMQTQQLHGGSRLWAFQVHIPLLCHGVGFCWIWQCVLALAIMHAALPGLPVLMTDFTPRHI